MKMIRLLGLALVVHGCGAPAAGPTLANTSAGGAEPAPVSGLVGEWSALAGDDGSADVPELFRLEADGSFVLDIALPYAPGRCQASGTYTLEGEAPPTRLDLFHAANTCNPDYQGKHVFHRVTLEGEILVLTDEEFDSVTRYARVP